VNRETMVAKVGLHIAKKYKTQIEAAKAFGFTQSYLSNSIRGGSLPKKLLEDMGYEEMRGVTITYTYDKKEKDNG